MEGEGGDAHLVEVGVGKVFAGVSPLDAGAVDENADFVAVGEDLGNEPANVFGRAQVGCVDGGFATESVDRVSRVRAGLVPLGFG